MKPSARDSESLIEEAAGAWRPTNRDGEVRSSPAWHDLDPASREQAFEVARQLRRLEAALDPDGLSTTSRRVLERIRRRG